MRVLFGGKYPNLGPSDSHRLCAAKLREFSRLGNQSDEIIQQEKMLQNNEKKDQEIWKTESKDLTFI